MIPIPGCHTCVDGYLPISSRGIVSVSLPYLGQRSQSTGL